MTPSRAFLTRGVSVLMTMPGAAGMAQEATGLGDFSTCVFGWMDGWFLMRAGREAGLGARAAPRGGGGSPAKNRGREGTHGLSARPLAAGGQLRSSAMRLAGGTCRPRPRAWEQAVSRLPRRIGASHPTRAG
jgi:hypothetical protein